MRSTNFQANALETAAKFSDRQKRQAMGDHGQQRPAATDADTPAEMADELSQILDTALFFLNGGKDAGHLVECLVLKLHDLRSECRAETWARLIPMAQAHPIREKLMADPFTRRSFTKPRGAGGARDPRPVRGSSGGPSSGRRCADGRQCPFARGRTVHGAG
ncbi:hypothetical protein KUV28_04685 [Ferrimonas balearica]|nr:hypothetical protein [Ferrimonas balearica]